MCIHLTSAVYKLKDEVEMAVLSF